jgi:hypothetical protein
VQLGDKPYAISSFHVDYLQYEFRKILVVIFILEKFGKGLLPPTNSATNFTCWKRDTAKPDAPPKLTG